MKPTSRRALIPIQAGWLPRKAACAHARAFTLVELLAVMAIVALLAGVLLPSVRSGLDSARSTKCVSNLRQIGFALAAYAVDNNNCYPPLTDNVAAKDWDQGAITNYLSLRPGGQQNAVFTCPAARFRGYSPSAASRAYSAADGLTGLTPAGQVAYNFTTPRSRASIQHPATAVLLFDGTQSGNARFSPLVVQWGTIYSSPDVRSASTNQVYIDYRHDRSAHFLMADGHAEAIAHSQASRLTQQVWQGL